MKPIIIYIDKDDEVKLSKKEFEKYIKEAYDQGYNCGYNDGRKYYWSPFYSGLTTCSNSNIDTNSTGHTPDKYPSITWTCAQGEASNAVGD